MHIPFKKNRFMRYVHDSYMASSIFPVLAYDDDNNYFLQDDKTCGFAFECQPLVGGDSKTQERLNTLMNTEFPKGTMMSMLLFRSPDIKYDMAKMMMLRHQSGFNDPLMKKIINERAEFFDSGTLKPVDEELGTKFFDLKLIISVKIPIKDNMPSKTEKYEISTYQKQIRSALKTIGVRPKVINGPSYTKIVSGYLNWGETASWRSGEAEYDEGRAICDQIMDYDKGIEINSDHVKVGDYFVQSLSAKRLPKAVYFGDALQYIGDLNGGNTGLPQHYAISCNILFGDRQKDKHAIERKRGLTVSQAKNNVVNLAPILAEKKFGFDDIYESMNENGNRPLKVSYSMHIFTKSKDEMVAASTQARTLWGEQRIELMIDKYCQWPVFINSVPLCQDLLSDRDIRRFKTMTAEQATVLAPIFGEWKGTGTPHINLISRNGQLMSFSMHDTGTNKNMLICATSGGGKSFFTNELILSYMSEGAKVWVIDVGRSYEKLCEAVNGQFMHFGSDSDVCVNPFDLTVSLDGSDDTRSKLLTAFEEEMLRNPDNKDEGEEDALLGLISAMASDVENLNDIQLSHLRRILNEAWKEHDRNTKVDHIRDLCLASKDSRINDVGEQLYSFSSEGSYGKYFNRKNNMTMDSQLTVLELEELKSRKHLQKVILFQLIYQIQQEVYLGDRNQKKVVIIDEAWDLIQNGGPEVQQFVEHAYRRFRKYGASVLLVTQGINDMYKSPIGEAIVDNSATIALFRHTEESVAKMKKEGKLSMPDGAFNLLKTVYTLPPHFSEIFIKSETGIGVGRLVVNDFQKLLYSTNPVEVAQIDALRDKGLSIEDAIKTILTDKYASSY